MDTDLIDSGALPALEGSAGLFLKHSGGLNQLIYRAVCLRNKPALPSVEFTKVDDWEALRRRCIIFPRSGAPVRRPPSSERAGAKRVCVVWM